MSSSPKTMIKFFFVLSTMMTSVVSTIGKGPMNVKREAMARVYVEVMNHTAVKAKLPPTDENDVINLGVAFWPLAILSMDEVDQSLSTIGYMEMRWNDEDLTWNASDFAGINQITLKAEDIWIPSIWVGNSAHTDFLKIPIDLVRLNHEGYCLVQTVVIVKTICGLDLSYYPFDSQNCDIMFVPFNENQRFINLTVREIKYLPDFYNFSGEWSIDARETVLQEISGVDMIMAKMKLKRSIMYYILCILAPILVTSSMASLVFWIPPGSGEKMSFLVSVFVSNAVFLNFIAGTMPRNMSEIPRLTVFLVFVILECFLCMVATIFVMRRYEAEQEEADKESEDAIFEQLENMTTSGLTEKTPESVTPTVKVDEGEIKEAWPQDGQYNGTLQNKPFYKLQGVFLTLMSRVKSIKSVRSNKSQPKRRMRARCRFCIRSSTWDVIFFVFFHLMSVPFYILLYNSYMGYDVDWLP